MFTCRQCRMHFTDAFDLFWLSSQVKLIDFDTVETVQPQTPKKAKARDTTSTSDLFSVQLRSTSFNFVQLRSTSFDYSFSTFFKGIRWFDMIFPSWFDMIWLRLAESALTSRCRFMAVGSAWPGCAWYRSVHCTRGTWHQHIFDCFLYLSIDTSNHMAPRHHWGGYIYILTSMKTVIKGKA